MLPTFSVNLWASLYEAAIVAYTGALLPAALHM